MAFFCYGRPYIWTSISKRSAGVDVIAANLDVVAVANPRVLALGHGRILTIIQPHDDSPCVCAFAVTLADLVADHTASYRASHRGGLASVALADLIAKHSTGDRTDDRAQGTAVTAALDCAGRVSRETPLTGSGPDDRARR